LATVLQFHVSGRILEGLGAQSLQRRLQEYQVRLDSASRWGRQPPRGPRWTLPGLPALQAQPEGAAISSANPEGLSHLIDGQLWMASGARPSDRPKATGDLPEVQIPELPEANIVGHPYQFRDLKTALDDIEKVLTDFYKRPNELPWKEAVNQSAIELHSIANEIHDRVERERSRHALLPYLQDLALEYRTVSYLLERNAKMGRSFPAIATLEMQNFLRFFIRSANNLINFIDHSGLVQNPIENARLARSWLQVALEGEEPHIAPSTKEHPHSPYQILSDGSYALTPKNLHILVLGDDNGPRTLELAGQGHTVTHLGFDDNNLRTTERRVRYRAEQKKRSGEWLIDPMVHFQKERDPHDPVDLIEAFFPRPLAELEPRTSKERLQSLQGFLGGMINARLKVNGSAFLISERDDAVEDLANLVLRNPNLELLEVRHRRTRLPLLGGVGETIEAGEAMVSWLVYRKLADANP
jgi:hypothetical protein